MMTNNQVIDNFAIAQSLSVFIDNPVITEDVFMPKYKGYLYDDLLFENGNIMDNSNNKNDLLKTEAKKYYWDEVMQEEALEKYTNFHHQWITFQEFLDLQSLTKDDLYDEGLSHCKIIIDNSSKEYLLILGQQGSGRYPYLEIVEKQGNDYVVAKTSARLTAVNDNVYSVLDASGNYVHLIEYNGKLFIESSFGWYDYKNMYYQIKYDSAKDEIYLDHIGTIRTELKDEKDIFEQTFLFLTETDIAQAEDFSEYALDMVQNSSFEYGVGWNGNGKRRRWNDALNPEVKSFEYDIDNDGNKEVISACHRYGSVGYCRYINWDISDENYVYEKNTMGMQGMIPFFTMIEFDEQEPNTPYTFSEHWQLYVETVDDVDYLVSWNMLNKYYAKANGYVVTAYQIRENQSLTPVYSTYIFIDSEYILIQ